MLTFIKYERNNIYLGHHNYRYYNSNKNKNKTSINQTQNNNRNNITKQNKKKKLTQKLETVQETNQSKIK